MKACKGKYIGFLDADDYAKQDMYEVLYNTAINSDSDVVICQSDRVDLNRKVISSKIRFGSSVLVENDLLKSFCSYKFGTGALWNKLYRADLIKRWALIEHDWRQDTNEDVLINIGVFKDARKVYLIKITLHEYTFNPESVTSRKSNIQAFSLLLKAYFLALDMAEKNGFTSNEKRFVTHLYRVQLDFYDYRIQCNDIIEPLDDSLVEVYKEFSARFPSEMILIISRLPLHKRASFLFRLKRFISNRLGLEV